MEQDRYQNHQVIFVAGLFSLVLGLSLFALSFYIMPSLLFGWLYDTPEFIVYIVEWLQESYNYTSAGASKLVFLIVFLLALFFSGIAYYSSNRIDNQIFSSELQAQSKPKKMKGVALGLILKIAFICLLIFLAATLFEWFIYTPPPS
jgi:hypothetical protein